jgi:hypothetical protein
MKILTKLNIVEEKLDKAEKKQEQERLKRLLYKPGSPSKTSPTSASVLSAKEEVRITTKIRVLK